jgi:lysophospholipase L1-like esterase
VTFTNLAVGGKMSDWGVEQAPAAAGHQPDVMIIAFGMNDASHAMPTETFIGNIREIMRVVQASSPQTEFVLVVGMLSNPEWTAGRHEFHAMHREALLAEAREGVAVADMASVWKEMVARKDLHSLTGNGVNHPNDFGHRVYAQVIGALLIPQGGSGREK